MGPIEFIRPIAFLLLLLLPVLWFATRRLRPGPLGSAERSALVLRCLLIFTLAVTMAEPRFVTTTRQRATAIVLDVSDSIPAASRREAQKWLLRILRDRDPLKEDVAFLVVADGTGIEVPFQALGGLKREDLRPIDPKRVDSILQKGETDLEGGLKAALASFPPGVARRVLLVTDGNETRGDTVEAVRSLEAAGIEVDVYPLRYRRRHEVLVEKVVAPPRTTTDRPVPVRAVIHSTEDEVPATVQFTDGDGAVLVSQDVTLNRGRNVFEIARPFSRQGFQKIVCTVLSPGDGDPANNRGTAAIDVEGLPAVLIVYRDEDESVSMQRALRSSGLVVDARPLADLPSAPGELLPYDTIVLLNAPASELSTGQMRMLQAVVEDVGIGLIAVGGPESFSAGGYGGTPLEEVLPVSMDVSQKRVLPNGAIVVVLHTCEFPNGNAWGRDITKAVIRSLGRNDYFGCVLWDGSVNWAVPIMKGNKSKMLRGIEQSSAMDMPSLHDCVTEGVEQLAKTNAYLKHMVIISDGDPAMPSDATVQMMVENKISCSAVAIAQHGVQDAMAPLCLKTGGRYYDLQPGQVTSLPAIFLKEAAIVRRSTVFEDPFVPSLTSSHPILKGIAGGPVPVLGGYVVTSSKERAEVPLVDPANGDPILAVWRVGVGKSAAFLSDLTGRWAENWLAWEKYDKFVTQLVRSCGRGLQRSTFSASVEASGGRGRAIVEAVDAEGNYVDGLAFDGTVVNPGGESTELRVLQTQQGRYEASFPATEPGLYLVAMEHDVPGEPGQKSGRAQIRAALPVDYSPEHLALSSNETLLAAMEASGARLRTGEDRPFMEPLPEARTATDAWRWALLAAILLFPFEVAARRLRLNPGPMLQAIATRIGALRDKVHLPKRTPRAPNVKAGGRKATAGKAGAAAASAATAANLKEETRDAPQKGDEKTESTEPSPASDLLRAKRRAKRRSTWEDNG